MVAKKLVNIRENSLETQMLISRGQPSSYRRNRRNSEENYFYARDSNLFSIRSVLQYCKWVLYVCIVIVMFYAYTLYSHPWIQNFHSTFVTVSYPHMVHQCRPYYIAGFNLHNAIEISQLHPSHYRTHQNKIGKQLLHDMFNMASSLGLNAVRIWAHSNNPRFPFQKSPGSYSNEALNALDYTVSMARAHGMKVIISFVDNWKYYNGVDQYVDWSQTAPERKFERFKDQQGDFHRTVFTSNKERRYENQRHALFFSDADSKNFYKAHMKTIINRVNRYTGYKYVEDPTIMAWDLINEPRCQLMGNNRCDQKLQKWYIEMAQYIKSLDPNHLVTTGSEGFWGKHHQRKVHNPDTWGELLGQDFIKNSQIQQIDFASMHVWPNNWNRSSTAFQRDWILEHLSDSESELKKPLLVEEFGRRLFPPAQNPKGILEQRDPIYQNMFNIIENSIRQGRPMAGSLFWRLFYPTYAGEQPDDYGVKIQDTTAKIIKDHARQINLMMNSIPAKLECELECWIPTNDGSCELLPWVCEEYFQSPSNHSQLFYTSQAECCWPVRGAYIQGCKNMRTLV